MSDLISREAALNAIKSYCDGCDNYNGVRCSSCYIDSAIIAVDAVLAVDAEPVRHGRWVYNDDDIMPYKSCSLCGREAFDLHGANYCPYCGAKMEGEGDE